MDTPLHWLVFNLFVLLAVALDLAVFHRRVHKISLREALSWSLVWIALALAFGLVVFRFYGRQPALEFFTGYVIEKALSGQFEDLKERILGVELFGRPHAYDTTEDAVVRVAACDVRKRLTSVRPSTSGITRSCRMTVGLSWLATAMASLASEQ